MTSSIPIAPDQFLQMVKDPISLLMSVLLQALQDAFRHGGRSRQMSSRRSEAVFISGVVNRVGLAVVARVGVFPFD